MGNTADSGKICAVVAKVPVDDVTLPVFRDGDRVSGTLRTTRVAEDTVLADLMSQGERLLFRMTLEHGLRVQNKRLSVNKNFKNKGLSFEN